MHLTCLLGPQPAAFCALTYTSTAVPGANPSTVPDQSSVSEKAGGRGTSRAVAIAIHVGVALSLSYHHLG